MGVTHCEMEGGIICKARAVCFHVNEIDHQAKKGGHKNIDTGELSGPHFTLSEWSEIKTKYQTVIPLSGCGNEDEAILFLHQTEQDKIDTGELHSDDDRLLLLPAGAGD